MKKRLVLKAGALLMAGAVSLAGITGAEHKVYGAQETGNLSLSQSAVWMNESEYKGEITLTVQGVESYFKEQTASLAAQEIQPLEQQAENMDPGRMESAAGQGSAETGNVMENQTEAENAGAANAAGTDTDMAAIEAVEAVNPEKMENAETVEAVIPEAMENAEAADAAGIEITGNIEAADTESLGETEGIEPADAEIFTETGISGEKSEAQAPVGGKSSSSLSLVYFLSSYFIPDTQNFPTSYYIEEIPVSAQNGEQDTVVKITIPLLANASYTEPAVYKIPILLKEEFRIPGQGHSYPISREITLKEGDTGQGVYLVRNEEEKILAKASMAYLAVRSASADFKLSVTADPQRPKAGERLTYEIILENTGEVSLAQIQLKNNFSQGGLNLIWEQDQGLHVEENGQGALLETLDIGEIRTLYAFVDIPESQEEAVVNTFHIFCENPANPQSLLERQEQVHIGVTPLKAEFTVEKTADRTIAMPGETIRYQICIRNTGEKTLHSVLSTERFLSSDIQAQFIEKAGVELNAAKNQALIPQILPGEAFALEAAVTLPYHMVSQELINQVIVVSRETGTHSVRSQAGVQVQALSITPTPTPWPTQYPLSNGLSKSGGSLAKQVSSYPKTEDTAHTPFWLGVSVVSFIAAAAVIRLRKGKRKH